METKRCTKCGRELTLDNFSKCASSIDGLQWHCKECHRKSVRNAYYKRKEESFGITPPNKVFTNPELAKFQPRELLAELKARGYVWEKMFAPRIEIKYEKI